MLKDLFDPVGSCTKSRLAILVEQLADKILSVVGDSDSMAYWVREVDRTLSNKEVHSVLVLMEEGWDSNYHFVNQNAQSPPVNRVVVSVSNEHLGSQVFCGSTERICEFAVLHKLGKTEISNE